MGIDNRKEVNDNREQTNDNSKKETGTDTDKTKVPVEVSYYSGSSSTISKTNSGMSIYEYNKQRGLYG